MNKWLRVIAVLCAVSLLCGLFAACDSGAGQPGDTTGAQTTGGGETTGGGSNQETTAGGAGDETTAQPETGLKVSDFSVYYSASAEANVSEVAETLATRTAEALGAAYKSVGDDTVMNEAEIDPNAYEILIGATNRPESAKALEALNGKAGYVVKMIGTKIVINASYDALLDEAVMYFILNCVEAGANGMLAASESLSHVQENVGSLTLLDQNGETEFSFVIGANVDTTSDTTSTGASTNRTDYVVPYFIKVQTAFQNALDVSMVTRTDAIPASGSSYEILLGRTNRPETEVFLAGLAPNEYGYGIVGNKIVITGWSDLTIAKAAELFVKNFSKYVTQGDKANFVLNDADKTVEAHKKWNVDIPLYNAGKLGGVVEALNDSYELYYENTTLEEYNAYCAAMDAQGYKQYQKNQIGDNHFATYTNGKTMIHVYYVGYLGAVRMVTESLTTAILPQMKDPYTKITDTTFTMMDLDNKSGSFGNAFIITLEDGSFIVHDGGATTGGKDLKELYLLLCELNQREDGVVVAAWIISHEHGDHFGNFSQMIQKYHKEIKLEKVIYNVSVDSFDYNTGNPASNVQNGTLNKIQMITGCELVRMHTGQTIQIRNLTIEAFYTWEDIYPLAPHHFNNTSILTRFYVGEGENKQRVSIVGDLEDVGSNIVVAMYGDAIKTDILQVAHHGWGGTVELYKYFKPTIVLWPSDQQNINSQLTPGKTGYYPVINQSLINQQNVLLFVVADNGHKTIPLPVVGLTNNRTENHDAFVSVIERFDGATSK